MPNQYTASSDTAATFSTQNILTGTDTYSTPAHGYRYVYTNTLLRQETDPLNFVTVYTYDVYANKLTETLPNGAVNVYAYDVLNRVSSTSFKDSTTAAAILLDEYEYNVTSQGETENVHKQYLNDSDTVISKETFDYANRLIKEEHADGGIVTYQYNGNGTLASRTDARNNSTYYSYDGLNRLIKCWEAANNNQYNYSEVHYDKVGNTTKSAKANDLVSNGVTPAANLAWITYKYDALNRLIEQNDSGGGKFVQTYTDSTDTVVQKTYTSASEYNTKTIKYNYFNKVKEEILSVESADLTSGNAALTTSYTYNEMGSVLTLKTPDNNTTSYSYDALERPRVELQPRMNENGTITTIGIVRIHDFMGNILMKIESNSGRTFFQYDKRGFLVKMTNAKSGITLYAYDRAGRKIAEVSPKNYAANTDIQNLSRKAYEYDLSGRVIKEKDIYKDQGGTWKTITREIGYDYSGNIVTEKDALGYITRYTYDGANRMLTMLDPVCAEKGMSYNKKYAYNGQGYLIEERNANDIPATYTYNDRGDVLTVATGGIVNQSNAYDLAGNKLSQSDGNGNTTTYTYNALGKIRTQTLPGDQNIASLMTTYKYTDMGQVAREETSLGKVRTYTYNNQGLLLACTELKNDNSSAITISNRYDVAGNLRFAVDGKGNTTEYTYDAINQKLTEKVTVTVSGQLTEQTTSIEYDASGNVTGTTDWKGNKYTNVYDTLNRVIEKRDPNNSIIEKLTYNDNHRQTGSADALNNTTTFTYDKVGRLVSTTDPSGNVKRQGYDAIGNMVSSTDGRGNVTNYNYDAQNRLTSVVNPLGETTAYTYDNAGNMLTQVDGKGNISTYAYNARNLPITRIDAGGVGTGGVIDERKAERYTYYSDGMMAGKTDRNGVVSTYGYDIHGRLTNDNVIGNIVNYTYDNNGNLLTMTDNTGTTTRTYDELGRVLKKTVPLIGTSTYAYDQVTGLTAGFSSEITTDPKGHSVTKVMDKAGRLYQVKDGNAVTATYTYFANGNRQKVAYQGGATEEYTYYANNQLKTLTNKKGVTTLEAYSYAYDANGNMSGKVDRKGTTNYTYDSLNRLLTTSEPSGKVTAYSFDASGNRESQTETSGSDVTVTSYTYNEQNRLTATETAVSDVITGGENYFYDYNGNMISKMLISIGEYQFIRKNWEEG